MKSKNNLAVFTQDSHASVFELGEGYFIYKSAKVSRSKVGDLLTNWFSVHEDKKAMSVIAGKIVGFVSNNHHVDIVFKKALNISVDGSLLDWGHEKCYHNLYGKSVIVIHDEVYTGQMIERISRSMDEKEHVTAVVPPILVASWQNTNLKSLLDAVVKENKISVLVKDHFPKVNAKVFGVIANPPFLDPLVTTKVKNKTYTQVTTKEVY